MGCALYGRHSLPSHTANACLRPLYHIASPRGTAPMTKILLWRGGFIYRVAQALHTAATTAVQLQHDDFVVALAQPLGRY